MARITEATARGQGRGEARDEAALTRSAFVRLTLALDAVGSDRREAANEAHPLVW